MLDVLPPTRQVIKVRGMYCMESALAAVLNGAKKTPLVSLGKLLMLLLSPNRDRGVGCGCC